VSLEEGRKIAGIYLVEESTKSRAVLRPDVVELRRTSQIVSVRPFNYGFPRALYVYMYVCVFVCACAYVRATVRMRVLTLDSN